MDAARKKVETGKQMMKEAQQERKNLVDTGRAFKFRSGKEIYTIVPGENPKVKLFFDMFSQLPSWFTNLWILVVASIYGIKGTQIFRNGGGKK